MKTDIIVNMLDREASFTGAFHAYEDVCYGPYLKLVIQKGKDSYDITEFGIFLQKENLGPLLLALDAITTKLRLSLYRISAPGADIWAEWNQCGF